MPPIHNQFEYNPIRRKLRNTMTPPEIVLWSLIKMRGLAGYKFRRQHGIGRYVVDFYCPKLHLAIELDGGQHFEVSARSYDAERTAYLNSLNILVVRIPNSEIFNNLDGVFDELIRVVSERAVSLTTSPPPTPK